jgi:hypothetical protein
MDVHAEHVGSAIGEVSESSGLCEMNHHPDSLRKRAFNPVRSRKVHLHAWARVDLHIRSRSLDGDYLTTRIKQQPADRLAEESGSSRYQDRHRYFPRLVDRESRMR